MRVNVMSKMWGVDDFELLWERRTILQGEDGTIYELMSLPDLIQAKKTQRDKDWPMIRRLVEADFAACRGEPSPEQVHFWRKEARTAALLIELARAYPEAARRTLTARRAVLEYALSANELDVEAELATEEREQRLADKAYWKFPSGNDG